MALFNNFPYTDLNDINLDYTLQKLESLYTRGEQLYSTLTTWQQATDAELEQWKAATESALALWKTQTENSIDNKIQLLTAAINASFTELRTQLEAHIAEIEVTAETAASNAASSAQQALNAASAASINNEQSKEWAIGETLEGDPVPSTNPAYENNAKYYADLLGQETEQIDTNTADIANLKSAITGTRGYLNSADLTVGVIISNSGTLTVDSSYTQCICTPASLIYPQDITITPDAGYRMYIFWTDGSNYATTSTGWKTEAVTIPANKHFMLSFRRVTDAGAVQVDTFKEYFPITPSLIGVAEKTVFEDIKNPIYVSSSSGNDNTGNGTASAPYKTITKGLSTGAKLLYVQPGLYKETISVSGRDIKILANWTDYTSGTVDDLPKVIIDGDSNIATALTIENCPSVKLEGIVVQNCTNDGALINKCYSIELINCEFSLNGRNGIVINYSNGVIRDCKGNSNTNDGFNLNYFGDTQFINCSGHDNGDDGISHHQGTTGMIDGGEWYNNVKGGVASPCYGAIVDVKNVYSHDNGYGIYASQDASGVSRTFHLWNCVLTNNSNYGLYSKYTTCYAYNNKISGNTTGQTTAPGGHIYTLD